MKILFLSAANNAHTIRIVNELAKKGVDVNLVSLKDHKHIEKYGNIDSRIKITYLPFKGRKGYYLNIYYLNKIVKKYSPNIVHVHYASGYGTLGRYLKFENKILNIWGSDIYIYPKKNIFTKLNIIKNLKAYKILATTSYCMKNEIKKYTLKPVFITPFGIDTSKYKMKQKNDISKEVVIGITKNLKEIYGIEYLIEGVSKLVKELEETVKIKLIIYGEGQEEEKLKKLVLNLNLKKYVEFKGYIPNTRLIDEIQKIDIMCFPSLSESFGVSALESMSCGIPTIASDADGFLEIIENEKDGLIIPKKSSEQIYFALKKLIEDPDLYKKLSLNSRKKILEKYEIEESTESFIKIYSKILKE